MENLINNPVLMRLVGVVLAFAATALIVRFINRRFNLSFRYALQVGGGAPLLALLGYMLGFSIASLMGFAIFVSNGDPATLLFATGLGAAALAIGFALMWTVRRIKVE